MLMGNKAQRIIAGRRTERKKRLERKKQKQERKKQQQAPEQTLVPPPAAVKKLTGFKYPPATTKTRYRIDVLASMYLDELVKQGAATDKIPEKALPGISFYEGLTLAADSLKKAGFSIDIYVHDISSAAESADALVGKGMLDSADLIIGAIPSHDVPVIANYAKNRKINFISTLSPSDGGVRSNKYFTLIQPSLKTHCEWILDDVTKKFPGMKISLLYRNVSEPDEHAFKYLTEDPDVSVQFRQLQCNILPDKASLSLVFDSAKPNVVIISLLDAAAADSLLKKLPQDFPSTHFEVYGMPSWGAISDLHKETAFPNLTVNVTEPFNIDAASPMGKYVMSTYKRNYGGKATEFVYRGFETMFWYANLLKQYGTIFNPMYRDNSTAPFTKFEIRPRRDREGHILYNENIHIYISRYEGGVSKTE